MSRDFASRLSHFETLEAELDAPSSPTTVFLL